METGNESFNLHQTMEYIGQAVQSILCNMLFDFALHGIILAIMLAVAGIYLTKCQHSYGPSISAVAGRLSMFCLLLALPGGFYLVINRHLPDAGVFSFNSIGLLCLWGLICTHLIAEEINNSLMKKNRTNVQDNY